MTSIVLWPDARLAAKAERVDVVSDDLRRIGAELLATAQAAPAYGLAAAHIGSVAPVVVVSAEGVPHRLLYCPEVVATADERLKGEEGSVSLPDVRVEVERPTWVDVRFLDGEGTVHEERMAGFLGRVAQHEIDQMNGVFFLDRISRLKRDMILKKLRKRMG